MTIKEELQEYARQCLSGVIISGKKHVWACRRFLEDCKKEEAALSLKEPWPYIWNEEAGNGREKVCRGQEKRSKRVN